MREFKVTLWCTCSDPKAAIKAARDMMERDGGMRSQIRDASEAVHCLIDAIPYDQRPGVEIESSEIEEV